MLMDCTKRSASMCCYCPRSPLLCCSGCRVGDVLSSDMRHDSRVTACCIVTRASSMPVWKGNWQRCARRSRRLKQSSFREPADYGFES